MIRKQISRAIAASALLAALAVPALATTPTEPLPGAKTSPNVTTVPVDGDEQADAKEFLSKMAARPGALRTASGLVILSQREGRGPAPTTADIVRVNYEGTLPDGTVFDSTHERGKPVSFPLDEVIPCWTEAVPKMKVGGWMRVVCPPELAYGGEGGPGIPPHSPLVFNIHLLGIGDGAISSPGKGKAERDPLVQQVASLDRDGATRRTR